MKPHKPFVTAQTAGLLQYPGSHTRWPHTLSRQTFVAQSPCANDRSEAMGLRSFVSRFLARFAGSLVIFAAGLLFPACKSAVYDNSPKPQTQTILIDNSVTTTKIVNSAITTEKIANTSITPEKLSQAYLPLAGGTMSGTLTMNTTIAMSGNRITDVATPTASADAATKGYVDAASATVAPDAVFSTTANNGLYNNLIATITPTAAYTEVCFKSGTRKYDIHAGGEATTAAATVGGSSGVGSNDCVPGDVGFIIERAERVAQTWTQARATCSDMQMRLPEPYEWKLACDAAATWSIASMTNDWEWGSNAAVPVYDAGTGGVVSAIFGGGGCTFAFWNWIGFHSGAESAYVFRCVR